MAGGKLINSERNEESWLNTVEILDLLPYFKQQVMSTGTDGIVKQKESQWKEVAPMLSARSNFALLALKDFVYVYGGISGKGSGTNSHRPNLVTNIIERYTVA